MTPRVDALQRSLVLRSLVGDLKLVAFGVLTGAAAVVILWLSVAPPATTDEQARAALNLARRWRVTFFIQQRQSERAELRARLHFARADSLERLANGQAAVISVLEARMPLAATPAESLAICQAINRACRGEVLLVRAENSELKAGLFITREDRDRWRATATAAAPVIDSTTAALQRSRCRILFMRCPTRTEAAVGGGLLGAAAVTAFFLLK